MLLETKINTNTVAKVIHECYWKLSKINTNTIAKVIHECYWKLSKIDTNTIAKVIHECYWKLLLLHSEAGDSSQAKKQGWIHKNVVIQYYCYGDR